MLLINCVPVFYLNNKIFKDNKKNIKTLSDIKWTGTRTAIENKIGIWYEFRATESMPTWYNCEI